MFFDVFLDANECALGTDNCVAPDATCVNTDGSFECTCNTDGLRLDDDGIRCNSKISLTSL